MVLLASCIFDRSWGVAKYDQSFGIQKVEVLSAHYKRGYKSNRQTWRAIAESETGKVWPLVRYYNKPYTVGEVLEVEIKCRDTFVKYCKVFEVEQTTSRLDETLS